MTALMVPGLLLGYMWRLGEGRFIYAVPLSASVLVLALIIARLVELGPAGFGGLLVAVLLLCAGSAAVVAGRRGGISMDCLSIEPVSVVPVLTLTIVAAYMLYAGPYTEVPGDAWWHIGRINDQMERLSSGSIGAPVSIGFDKFALYWYTALAYFLHVTGSDLRQSLAEIALANGLMFSAGVYAFALCVFRRMENSRLVRHAIAAATVCFFIAYFGVGVFSYIRYYAFGPTILNYLVYLAAIVALLEYFRTGSYLRLCIVPVCLLTAALLHAQEALFIMVMAGALALVEYGRGKGRSLAESQNPASEVEEGRARRVALVCAAGGIAYGVLHTWAYLSITRHNPLAHGLLADIRNFLPFLQNLYVLKPTGQFYQVVTVWGVVVYGLFLWRWRSIARSNYLVAGMAIPILTVFNPVFTDLFLRLSWPEVLWRMCYMLPLPLVGGWLFVQGARSVLEDRRMPGRAGALLVAALLLVLLLPIRTTYFVSANSKIYTLAPVAAANDHRLWADLLSYLDQVEGTYVMTDPVTGYVINGLTPHTYRGYKFYGTGAMPVDRPVYGKGNFINREGWLVVVNQRDGADSAVGRYSGHWPKDVMKVSTRYSTAFLEFLQDHPGMFEKQWSSDRIAVYRVLGRHF